MAYKIKEIYYTLQGEGLQSGMPALFCRFTGCNLWSGREEDRHKAICQFCDTDFRGTDGINGGVYQGHELVDKLKTLWPSSSIPPRVVFTGGEPLLQLDEPLIDLLREETFFIAIETNGTLPIPKGIDHVCVSPKMGSELSVHQGDELKLVYPQVGCNPQDYLHLDFTHFYLQPMDPIQNSVQRQDYLQKTLEYCLQHPEWKLSLQTHKLLDIP